MEERLNANRFRRVAPPVKNLAAARTTMHEIEEFERKVLPDCQRPDTA